MNIKSPQYKVNPEFQDLFSFETKEDTLDHLADMISLRILSEVEKICEEKNIKKKDLAELVGTSRSYITQLFRGDKHVNVDMMAKFEYLFEFTYNIRARKNEDTEEDFLAKHLPPEYYKNQRTYLFHCFEGGLNKGTQKILNDLKTDNKAYQKAG